MKDVGEIAKASADDGTTSTATVQLSKFGKHKQNSNRDFHRAMQRKFKLMPELAFVGVFFLASTGLGGLVHRPFPMYLPHEMIWMLYTHRFEVFKHTFAPSPESLAAYWEGARLEPWFEDHVGKAAILKSPATVCPMRLHGDDAAVKNDLSGLMMSSSSPLGFGKKTMQSVFPLFYLLLKFLVGETLEKLVAVMVWSFG